MVAYSCIKPDCTVVLELAGDDGASALVLITRNKGEVGPGIRTTLDTSQIEMMCRSMAYAYKARIGKLPRMPGGSLMFTDQPREPEPAASFVHRTFAVVRERTRQRG